MDYLQTVPDNVVILQDGPAKDLLLQLGLIARFTPKKTQPNPTTPNPIQAVFSTSHKTHYVVGLYFSGHKKKDENGYVFYAYPKNSTTYAQFQNKKNEMLREMGGSGAEGKRFEDDSDN